jgi:hypothetical protein
MTAFLKPVLFTGLGVCCLAIGAGAQAPVAAPAAAPAPQPALTRAANAAQSVPLTAAAQGTTTYSAFGSPFLAQGGSFYGAERFDPEARKIAKQIADAKTDGDKEKGKDKLKEHLDKQFEDRQKQHEKDVAALEEQVKKLKDMISKRKENKREIIDERTKQLIREAQGLGW